MRRDRKDISGFGALARFALIGILGGAAAGCSDSMRLADPMSNPFSKSARVGEPARTGSIPNASAPAPVLRTESVQSQPLGAPQAAAAPLKPAPAPIASPRSTPPTGGPAGWTSRGGTSITVAAGDSLDTLSNRYGVPPAAILSANGLKGAFQIAPGKQIVIPVYQASDAGAGAPAVTPRPGKIAEASTSSAQTKIRFVEGAKPAATPGRAETSGRKESELTALRERVARLESEKAAKVAAKEAKSAPASKGVASAAEKTKPAAPASKVAAKAETTKHEPVKVEAQKVLKAEPQKFAKLESPKAAPKVVEPAPKPTPVVAAKPEPAKPAPEAAKPAIKEPEQTASIAAKPADDGNFRWPARGRVISGYGASGNEGINIAVPEGTPVKAAEEGTVAYAGSDVKGYGNLVLIRHANGYVSAYAHNGDISVKPGEKVKRGQVVAKSGQSGNVTSPQLHFEIRKGATPVDPTPHLASN